MFILPIPTPDPLLIPGISIPAHSVTHGIRCRRSTYRGART